MNPPQKTAPNQQRSFIFFSLFGVISVNCFVGGEQLAQEKKHAFIAGTAWQRLALLLAKAAFVIRCWRSSCFCFWLFPHTHTHSLFFLSTAQLTPHSSHPLSARITKTFFHLYFLPPSRSFVFSPSFSPSSFDSRFWLCLCIVILDACFFFLSALF